MLWFYLVELIYIIITPPLTGNVKSGVIYFLNYF